MSKVYMPKVGCLENSQMGKTLELLSLKGIDCIKIDGPRHRADKTVYYPINMLEEGNFVDDIKECGGNILTDEFMEIEVDCMSGNDIMNHNSNFQLKDNMAYDVIKIGYVNDKRLLDTAK